MDSITYNIFPMMSGFHGAYVRSQSARNRLRDTNINSFSSSIVSESSSRNEWFCFSILTNFILIFCVPLFLSFGNVFLFRRILQEFFHIFLIFNVVIFSILLIIGRHFCFANWIRAIRLKISRLFIVFFWIFKSLLIVDHSALFAIGSKTVRARGFFTEFC